MPTIRWKLHTSSSPDRVFNLWTTDAGRTQFWCEKSTCHDEVAFSLTFIDGTVETCRIHKIEPSNLLVFSYFDSLVRIELFDDGQGGTDLTLTNENVPVEQYSEVLPGWLNVLFPLKAAADHGVDLRNHDRRGTWRDGFVDQ